MLSLPIDQTLPQILQSFEQHSNGIIIAPPGSGKSTRVPPALSKYGKVLLLQPRRAAAKLIAKRIATEKQCKVGEEVGYQIRFEKKWSSKTKVLVVTEGILLRRLQSDPFLEDISVVILDEFHERSLSQDLALAMLKEVQQAREDLKLVMMSATLDPTPIIEYFDGQCQVFHSAGRKYPVQIRHDPYPATTNFIDRCAARIETEAKSHTSGDILVFLPGSYEIKSIHQRLSHLDWLIMPLYGALPIEQQEAAIERTEKPKIILSTNIAETSITLPDVTLVIDSGLHRVSYLNRGHQHLKTEPISLASAQQRSGRAGRVQPGACHRMWTLQEEQRRARQRTPEIHRQDLSAALLQILQWGSDPTTFHWLDNPLPSRLNNAMAWLTQIGALADNQCTALGEQLSTLPIHPQLGKTLIEAANHGVTQMGAIVCVLIEQGSPFPHLNLFEQIERVKRHRCAKTYTKGVAQLMRYFHKSESRSEQQKLLIALLKAFPDRIGQRRRDQMTYQLADGSEAKLSNHLCQLGEWILALVLHQSDQYQRQIKMAVSITKKMIPV